MKRKIKLNTLSYCVMWRLASRLAIIAALTHASSVSALTFDEIAHAITVGNTEIAIATIDNRSDAEALKAENMLNNPEVEFGYLWGQNDVGNKWDLSITQEFDWPGAYRARSKAAEVAGKAADKAVEIMRLDLLREVKAAMVELVATRRKLQLLNDVKQNVDTLLVKTTKGFTDGETTILDINKLKIELISVERQISDLVSTEQSVITRLTTLNGGRPVSSLLNRLDTFPTERLATLDDYLETFDNGRHQQYCQLTRESFDRQIKAARSESLPGFSIGYSFENEMGDKFHGVTAGISLPIYSRRSKINSLKLKAHSAGMAADQTLSDAKTGVVTDFNSAQRLYDDIRQYGPVLSNTDHIRLIRKAYDGGQISLLDMLQESNYFLEASIDLIDMEQQYYTLLTGLNTLISNVSPQ